MKNQKTMFKIVQKLFFTFLIKKPMKKNVKNIIDSSDIAIKQHNHIGKILSYEPKCQKYMV